MIAGFWGTQNHTLGKDFLTKSPAGLYPVSPKSGGTLPTQAGWNLELALSSTLCDNLHLLSLIRYVGRLPRASRLTNSRFMCICHWNSVPLGWELACRRDADSAFLVRRSQTSRQPGLLLIYILQGPKNLPHYPSMMRLMQLICECIAAS